LPVLEELELPQSLFQLEEGETKVEEETGAGEDMLLELIGTLLIKVSVELVGSKRAGEDLLALAANSKGAPCCCWPEESERLFIPFVLATPWLLLEG
jgi:hypothetical protein